MCSNMYITYVGKGELVKYWIANHVISFISPFVSRILSLRFFLYFLRVPKLGEKKRACSKKKKSSTSLAFYDD